MTAMMSVTHLLENKATALAVMLLISFFCLFSLWPLIGGRRARKHTNVWVTLSLIIFAFLFFYMGPMRCQWFLPGHRNLLSFRRDTEQEKIADKGVETAENGNPEAAIKILKQAVATLPVSSKTLFDLAVVCDQADRKELMAIAWYRAYLEAMPDVPSRAGICERMEEMRIQAEKKAKVLTKAAEEATGRLMAREKAGKIRRIDRTAKNEIFLTLAKANSHLLNEPQTKFWLNRIDKKKTDPKLIQEILSRSKEEYLPLPEDDTQHSPHEAEAMALAKAGDATGAIAVLQEDELFADSWPKVAEEVRHHQAKHVFQWIAFAWETEQGIMSYQHPENWAASLRKKTAQPEVLTAELAREAERTAYFLREFKNLNLKITNDPVRYNWITGYLGILDACIMFGPYILLVLAVLSALTIILKVILRLFGRRPKIFKKVMLPGLTVSLMFLLFSANLATLREIGRYMIHDYAPDWSAVKLIMLFFTYNVIILLLARVLSWIFSRGPRAYL